MLPVIQHIVDLAPFFKKKYKTVKQNKGNEDSFEFEIFLDPCVRAGLGSTKVNPGLLLLRQKAFVQVWESDNVWKRIIARL